MMRRYSVYVSLVISIICCFVSISSGQDGAAISSLADVTVTGSATLVKANTSGRAAMSCTVPDGGANVRWGDSTVTAAKGQRVPAGASIEIRNRGPIYMISEGANVVVSCTEEIK